MSQVFYGLLVMVSPLLVACGSDYPEIQQWTTFEVTLQADRTYEQPYISVEAGANFINDQGREIMRPAFWDGGNTWKIRFTPPDSARIWSYRTFSNDSSDRGLHGIEGKIKSISYAGDNELLQHGLLRMSPGNRNVIHHDGTSFVVVGDTPWALPFRATLQQVREYAADRQEKGFNTALLMSVQPDMKAEGPDARNTIKGFARGFADLSQGHINELQPEYFQYLDTLIFELIDHGIVPVYQPVFHGFGWKGLQVLGNLVDTTEYVRYNRYLLARYGSMPAMWLVAGDRNGDGPGIKASGQMLEEKDAYHQPTGLHYNPCDDYIAEWAFNDSAMCMHYNQTYQAEPWLDFQWAQTGHSGEHLYHKVERMYENQPVKAVLNGEPTYEGMGDGQYGLGWWQGEEAWMQLMHGGTMGVVYGAASLWQWKVTADEEGWGSWSSQQKSWKEAMNMEGSRYVGYVGKALEGLDFADIERRWDLTEGNRPLLAKEEELYVSYLPEGGTLTIEGVPAGLTASWFDPKRGRFEQEAETSGGNTFTAPGTAPWVLIIR